jgi:peptidoglycan-associated lipoprotein
MRILVTVIMTLGLAIVAPHMMIAQLSLQHAEIAVDYTWMHSNAPPGGCGCFKSQGGSVTGTMPLRSSPFSAVAHFTVGTTSSTAPGFYGSLQVTTFTAGLRY